MNAVDHERLMRRAIELAAHNPRAPFAAAIADRRSHEIVAEGWNRGGESPICHGEIDALNRLFAEAKPNDCSYLILYTTAEPCPMCQGAILWAGVGAVVFGTSIPTLQSLGWSQIDIRSHEVVERSPGFACEITGGVLEAECDRLFAQS